MTDFNLRMPSISDASRIVRLVHRCKPLDVNSHYLYLLLCEHFRRTCAVADADGDLAAFVSAYRIPDRQDTLFVWQIAVDENYRGRRLASRLLDEVLGREACAGVQFVEATFSPSNASSEKLFRSLARRFDTGFDVRPLFTQELFSGVEPHEEEDLCRVGPFTHSRSP